MEHVPGMTDRPAGPPPALKERREVAIKSLIAHFADDRLTVEEFESRLDLAHRAVSAAELEALVADLPATQPDAPPAAAPASVPDVRPSAPPLTVPRDQARSSQTLVAILGGVERKGHWTPARKTHVVAFMGGAVLDLREAQLAEGDTEIAIFTMWGGVEIIVAPGTKVDAGGIAIMGGFEHHIPAASTDPRAPCVKVSGLAIMGGVELSVRLPGESAGDARRRLRAEKKRLKRGNP
jgi:hypothetical protein